MAYTLLIGSEQLGASEREALEKGMRSWSGVRLFALSGSIPLAAILAELKTTEMTHVFLVLGKNTDYNAFREIIKRTGYYGSKKPVKTGLLCIAPEFPEPQMWVFANKFIKFAVARSSIDLTRMQSAQTKLVDLITKKSVVEIAKAFFKAKRAAA
jgi:hypothetical protein